MMFEGELENEAVEGYGRHHSRYTVTLTVGGSI